MSFTSARSLTAIDAGRSSTFGQEAIGREREREKRKTGLLVLVVFLLVGWEKKKRRPEKKIVALAASRNSHRRPPSRRDYLAILSETASTNADIIDRSGTK